MSQKIYQSEVESAGIGAQRFEATFTLCLWYLIAGTQRRALVIKLWAFTKYSKSGAKDWID